MPDNCFTCMKLRVAFFLYNTYIHFITLFIEYIRMRILYSNDLYLTKHWSAFIVNVSIVSFSNFSLWINFKIATLLSLLRQDFWCCTIKFFFVCVNFFLFVFKVNDISFSSIKFKASFYTGFITNNMLLYNLKAKSYLLQPFS